MIAEITARRRSPEGYRTDPGRMPDSFRDRPGQTGRARMRTVKRAAEELDVDERTIWRAIARGELVVHRFGRAVRIADDDFRRYIANKRQV